MKEIDWSKAPGDAIGAFSQGESQTFFVKTKEPSDYMNRPGYKGFQCDGNVYHVFTEFWAWSERPWAGEGLPPVGTVCEWKHAGQWLKVEVAYLSEWLIVLRDTRKADSSPIDPEGVEIAIDHWKEDAPVFRPIRTPEQIAAEEREKAIAEMRAALPDWAVPENICPMLYDAGYRKVTP